MPKKKKRPRGPAVRVQGGYVMHPDQRLRLSPEETLETIKALAERPTRHPRKVLDRIARLASKRRRGDV
jgi:hypothetical protein